MSLPGTQNPPYSSLNLICQFRFSLFSKNTTYLSILVTQLSPELIKLMMPLLTQVHSYRTSPFSMFLLILLILKGPACFLPSTLPQVVPAQDDLSLNSFSN